MAFERATPPALRWVAIFLAACAVLGLTLGFRDQMRRNPPAWYTGAQEKAVAGGGLIDAQEAVAFDPQAPKPALQIDEAPKPAPQTEESKAAEAEDQPATPAPEEKAPEPPAAPKAKPPAPKIEPLSEDPVGDLLEGQKKAPEAPPTVPY